MAGALPVEMGVACIEAARDLAVEMLREEKFEAGPSKQTAERVGEAYKIILAAVMDSLKL